MAEGTLPVLSPEIYHTGHSFTVTLPPTSIGFWVLPGLTVKPCLTLPVGSRSEASDKATYRQARSMNSTPFPDYAHSDHETDSHMRSESKGYETANSLKELSNKIKRKIHSKKNILKNTNDEFLNKIMEETKLVTDGDFERDSTEAMEEIGKNVKNESIREKTNEIKRGAQERYRRYVAETGTYVIPGLEPDYFQPNNGISIKNLLWRRNRGDRLQKLAKISKHEGNIQTSIYEPHHHADFEDVNEGFPVISSYEHAVHTLPRGGIYMRQGGESFQERNKDYDYVDKDENVNEEDENISSEPEHFHGPTEYFETLQTPRVVADERFSGYGGELSEAEFIALAKPSKQEEEQGSSNENDEKVIQEQGLTDEEDRKIKDATTRMLNTYYGEIYRHDTNDEGVDFEQESGVKRKYKTDIKKKISNRRNAEERNRKYSDKIVSKMAHHRNNIPDSYILTVKTEKDAINENDVHNDEYDDDTYVPAEEVEISRSIHKIKESFAENHDRNIPRINEEYYHEGSHSSRTRRQGRENSKKINQRNDLQETKDDDQDSYQANHEILKNQKIFSASQSHSRDSKERARKISHKVIYSNSNEEDNSSDIIKNHSKQNSKNNITQKSSQRRAKESNEDDESESESLERSQQYNAKSKMHNQKVHHKNNNSGHDEYSHEHDSAEVGEDDNKQKIMKRYSGRRKYVRAAYQQNINNGKNVDEVSELAVTVREHNPIESIIPSYRKKSSRRTLNNTHRTNNETGKTATQGSASSDEKSGEELHIKHKMKKHSSRTEVTSNESEEMPEINEYQEKATEENMENKSRQKDKVTNRMPTSDKERRRRVRRDVPSQSPMTETSVENRRKWTDARKGTSQKKYTELESDSINAKLKVKPHNIKENKKLQTPYRPVPTDKIFKPNGGLESSEGNKQMNVDHNTEKYISDEFRKYNESTEEINTNSQHKISNTLLDEYDDKQHEEEGTSQNYWKFHSDRSLEYFMDPEKLQNVGHTKREIGNSFMFEPSNDITINGNMEEEAVNTERGLRKYSKMAKSVKNRERGESPIDVLFGETVLPATSVAVLTDKHTQQTGMVNHEEGLTNVDEAENIYKNQNDALNMKLYQEELEEPKTGAIRLPKAIATHIHLQHNQGKVTTGGNEYKEDLLSNEEKHNKSTIMTEEETGKTVLWNTNLPMKMEQEVHADKNDQLPFGATQHRPKKSSTFLEQDKEVSHVAEQITKDTEEILPSGDNMALKQNLSPESSVKLHKSNSDSNVATSTESSESQVQSLEKKDPVIDDIRNNIHSIIDKLGVTVMKASNDIKENKNNDKTFGNLKNVHYKVMEAEDKIFKTAHDIMKSRSPVDGDPANEDLAELKTKNGPEQEHSVNGADRALENIPHFMDENSTISSHENGTDGTYDRLEDFVTSNIADDEHTADPLIRNAKDIEHLKHIAATRGILNHNARSNANEHIKLQLSTLAKNDHIRAELEKKRLERLLALSAQRAKLKEDLLKIRAKATEGKLKLAHHINRRDTTHDEHVQSLMTNSETNVSHAPASIQNEDIKNYAKKVNPSIQSKHFRETNCESSSHTGQNNRRNFSQDRHRQPQLTSLPVSIMTNTEDIQIPALRGQQIHKIPHYSESKILPRNCISDSKSEGIPFITLYCKGPAKILFQTGHTKEIDPDKENISQKYNLNSSPDQSVTEDASVEDQNVEIKQMPLPQFIPRLVPNNDPAVVQFQNIPISENDIRFYFDSEKDKVDDGRDLTRKQRYTSSILKVSGSDSPYHFINIGVTDDDSLNENWKQLNIGETQMSLIPVTEENDPNQQPPLPKEVNKGDAGGNKRIGKSSKMYNYKKGAEKYRNKHLNTSSSVTESDHPSLHDKELDEVEPSTLRMSDTTKSINKHSADSENNILHVKNKQNFILQPLTHDLGIYSELIPGSSNLHSVSMRSKRALPHPFNNKFNDDIFKPLTMTSKDNPRTEDNMNGKYWLQSFLKNSSTTSGNKGKNQELNSSIYDYMVMPVSNKLITSSLASESNMLSDTEEFQLNPESIPTNSFSITNIKLITNDKSKDMKNISDKSSETNQTYLENLGNNINDIINVEAGDDTENENKIKDDLNKTSNEVNLQTNEIKRHFRTSNRFVMSKHYNSINKAENEEKFSEMKGIPYKLHKHVLNSNYKPIYSKMRKYLYPHEYKLLEASSEELPSTEYSITVNKLGNRSSPDKTNDISKIFNITLEEFPNINTKSVKILATSRHNITNTAEEIPKIATEYKDISDVPVSSTIMANTDTDYFTGPAIKKQGKESLLISQTYPQDNLNYFFRSMKNVAALEQKAVDTETTPNSEKDTKNLDAVNRNTEHVEVPGGQEVTDNNEENKPTSTTGYIHKLFKNISNHVVKFFHSISPWNYFNH